ncbi:hypothetical protein K502DRAFT_342957 [Neoconidiobolus thromboides FSU 785]|nr:hypothetical protein K502DRAFT_342957 [Neoconidiobolus thromboides FSU 785]
MDSNIFYIGDKRIVDFSWDKLKAGISLKYFNIEKNEWYNEYIIKDLFDRFNTSSKETTPNYSILQNEKNIKQFYISGFILGRGKNNHSSVGLKLFDITTKRFETIANALSDTYLQQLFILNNKIYYFKTKVKYNSNKNINYDTLHQLDLISNKINVYNIKFEQYDELKIVKNNQSVYFIVYNASKINNITIYEFQQNPFSFRKMKVIQMKNFGCFIIYKDYLINSFGIQLLNSKNDGLLDAESSNMVGIYNINNWTQINYLPSLINTNNISNYNSDKNGKTNDKTNDDIRRDISKNNNEVPIGSIIGGIIGLLLLLLLFFLFIKYKYKYNFGKDQNRNIISEPILIDNRDLFGTIKAKNYSILYNKFREIKDGSIIIPEKPYISFIKNTNYSILFDESSEIDDDSIDMPQSSYISNTNDKSLLNNEPKSLTDIITSYSCHSATV